MQVEQMVFNILKKLLEIDEFSNQNSDFKINFTCKLKNYRSRKIVLS